MADKQTTTQRLAKIEAKLDSGAQWMGEANKRFDKIDTKLEALGLDKAVRDDRTKRHHRIMTWGAGVIGAGLVEIVDKIFK